MAFSAPASAAFAAPLLAPSAFQRGLSSQAGRTQTPATSAGPTSRLRGRVCVVVPGLWGWFLVGVRLGRREGRGNTDYWSPSPEPPCEALQSSVSHFILRFRGVPAARTLGLLPNLPTQQERCDVCACRLSAEQGAIDGCVGVCVGREGEMPGRDFCHPNRQGASVWG